jgi:hypothetical protein
VRGDAARIQGSSAAEVEDMVADASATSPTPRDASREEGEVNRVRC